jgi:hypothetical protein
MTRTFGTALASLVLAAAAPAQEVLRRFEPIVVADAAGPRTTRLLTIADPGITQPRYALVGQVRYDGVEGACYLEMWSEFPGKGSFFTRTLGDHGPMARIAGTSPWRDFELPFDATGAPAPTRLTVNLVLPGRGAVELGPMRLVQYAATGSAGKAWWGPRAAGLAGGVAGAVLGGFGALIGVLVSLGRGRAFVLGLLNVEIVLGAIVLAAGVVALQRAQPYEVYYPLLLCGALCVGLAFFGRPVIRRRYEEAE